MKNKDLEKIKEEIMASIITGNSVRYIREVSKRPLPTPKNNYWGLGADNYYQGVIEGIVNSFKRLMFFVYFIFFLLSLLIIFK